MSGTGTGTRNGRRAAARARAAQLREQQERSRKRRRRLLIGGIGLVVVAAVTAVVLVVTLGSTGGGDSGPLTGPLGPEGMALEQGTALAADTTAAAGPTREGVQCSASEQVAYHIHTHLTVYVDGRLRPIPGGVGVVAPVAQTTDQGTFYQASRCYYWLHVHAADGVIHVEAPSQATYTLGQFFAVWGQPLSSGRVASATGTETVFVDGHRYTGDPAAIPLKSREAVQIDVGTVVPFRSVDWSRSRL